MAEFERIEVGRHVLGPGDTLLIRVRPGTTADEARTLKAAIDEDGRLAGRVLIIAAEQFVIVRKGESVANVA
jgi:hypothetical protein